MRRVLRIGLPVSAFVLLLLLPPAAAFAIRTYVAHAIRTFVRSSPPVESSFTLSNGGVVRVSGSEVATIIGRDVSEMRRPVRTFVWHARYQAPSTTSDEFIGTWQGRTAVTRGFNVGGLVVVMPDVVHQDYEAQRIFIRTKAGRWKETSLYFGRLADAFDPPLLTSAHTSIGPADLQAIKAAFMPRPNESAPNCSVESFSPERAELRLRFDTPRVKGHLRLTLSSDGETWQLAGIDRDQPGTAAH
jgi:hypothetical protein